MFEKFTEEKNVLMKHHSEGNSFLSFERDYLCYSTESKVGTSELMAIYSSYCKANGMSVLKAVEVHKYLLSRPYVRARKMRDDERLFRGYVGVGFKK